jgi:predicted nucleic acid-binding protein
MAGSALVDAGFLVALLNRRDGHHRWAAAQAVRTPPPWSTCESALSEAFHLLGPRGMTGMAALLERQAVVSAFDLRSELGRVINLMQKYDDVPMSLADACLVRMTETFADPVLLTTDQDFLVYRRHGRRVVPVRIPR